MRTRQEGRLTPYLADVTGTTAIKTHTFIECGVWVNPDLSVVQPEEPIHENIRIIDNVFVKTGVKAKGARKLTITGNRSADGPLPIEIDSSCTEVKIENNEQKK